MLGSTFLIQQDVEEDDETQRNLKRRVKERQNDDEMICLVTKQITVCSCVGGNNSRALSSRTHQIAETLKHLWLYYSYLWLERQSEIAWNCSKEFHFVVTQFHSVLLQSHWQRKLEIVQQKKGKKKKQIAQTITSCRLFLFSVCACKRQRQWNALWSTTNGDVVCHSRHTRYTEKWKIVICVLPVQVQSVACGPCTSSVNHGICQCSYFYVESQRVTCRHLFMYTDITSTCKCYWRRESRESIYTIPDFR